MYTVYALKNNEGEIYIGQTNNIELRLEEHNKTGKGYTSKFRSWKLIYSEEYKTRSNAMNREKYLKIGKGREELQQLISGA